MEKWVCGITSEILLQRYVPERCLTGHRLLKINRLTQALAGMVRN